MLYTFRGKSKCDSQMNVCSIATLSFLHAKFQPRALEVIKLIFVGTLGTRKKGKKKTKRKREKRTFEEGRKTSNQISKGIQSQGRGHS